MIWVYDGSYNGLLTAVFEWFERKPGYVTLQSKKHYVCTMFNEALEIHTQESKAERVSIALQQKLSKEWHRKVYCCWLSQSEKGHSHIFNFILEVFQSTQAIYNNYGNEHVHEISKLARSVEREKHRMEAFIRFEKLEGDFFCAKVEPDFDVLPLIAKHFKDRYSNQQWLIYDLKRGYGLYHNLKKLEIVAMEKSALKNTAKLGVLAQQEDLYQSLWKEYFTSTNIEARKNTKLHLQHVPRRFHKYLTELINTPFTLN